MSFAVADCCGSSAKAGRKRRGLPLLFLQKGWVHANQANFDAVCGGGESVSDSGLHLSRLEPVGGEHHRSASLLDEVLREKTDIAAIVHDDAAPPVMVSARLVPLDDITMLSALSALSAPGC